jgi:peroxiredoxin Q/BCP
MLKSGDRIPDFDLVTDRGERVSPKTLKGARAVLYFYPKDDTPGCTKEACAFRDALPKFDAAKVRVYGISADDEKRHAKFATKYALNFPLIADPERQAIEGFGVWVEKSMYGRSYMGIARASFAIDATGKVEQVWDKVKPETHAEEVLAWMTGAAPAAAKKAAPAKKAVAKKVAKKR